MFKRRTRRRYSEVVWETFYPRGGWTRAFRYIGYRLRRLPGPAHKIARGISCGVFICFTPFFGLHFVLSGALAWMIGGNVLAALLATFVGNPITFPIIAVMSVELGSHILGQPSVPLQHIVSSFSYASVELWSNFAALFNSDVVRWNRLEAFFDQVFWPYLIGGIGPGLLVAIVAYYVSHPLIVAYQRARMARLKRKIAKLRAAQEQADSSVSAG